MSAAKISLYSDASALYEGRIYKDVYDLMDCLREQLRASHMPPMLELATEAPVDYDATGQIIYGLMRLGLPAEMLDADPNLPVDPRPVV